MDRAVRFLLFAPVEVSLIKRSNHPLLKRIEIKSENTLHYKLFKYIMLMYLAMQDI